MPKGVALRQSYPSYSQVLVPHAELLSPPTWELLPEHVACRIRKGGASFLRVMVAENLVTRTKVKPRLSNYEVLTIFS